MHELSIVAYVVKEVEAVAQQNDLTRVSSVTLEFGEVSGIVTEYISDCWQWYVQRSPLMSGAALKCETIPAVTWCSACKRTYPTVSHGKICPYCGSAETWLKQGNEINIKEIEAC